MTSPIKLNEYNHADEMARGSVGRSYRGGEPAERGEE